MEYHEQLHHRWLSEIRRRHGLFPRHRMHYAAIWQVLEKHNIPNDVKRIILNEYNRKHGAPFPEPRDGYSDAEIRHWLINLRRGD